MLSGIEPLELMRAIERGDVARLTAIPGVGKKTSERIVARAEGSAAARCRPPRSRPAAPVPDAVRAARRCALGAGEPGVSSAARRKSRRCRGQEPTPDGGFERTLKQALRELAEVTGLIPHASTAARVDEDAQYEAGLRPRVLDEYIGQDRIRENLQVAIAAAKQRGEPLDHVLLHGPPGLGKTTLAYVIANEMGVQVRATSGPAIEKPGDLVGIVTNLAAGEVLFIDEIHRMSPAVEEILYPALEDYEVDIVIGQGPSARTVKMRLERFTLIGATTRTGLLTSPLRSRFGIVHRLEFYTPADLEEIVRRSARILERADRRRRRGRDRAAGARHAAHRQPAAAPRARLRAGARRRARSRSRSRMPALKLLEVDEHGFDEIDRKLLRTIIDKFGGGPVGLNTIAAAISEEKDAIEDIYEPFLIQIGFLDRTPRGRVATPLRLRLLRARRARRTKKGFTTVVTDTTTAPGADGHACRRPADDDSVAGDLRAAARADQRRSREDGRDDRRVDPAADRHPRAPHRRSRRRHVGSRPGGGGQGDRERAGLTPDDIGVIIVGTVTPDMMFPSTACLIQHKIGAPHAWGFDLSAACSAFTYSLTTASQLVATGAHDHALVVGADVMSSIIDYKDRSTCVLFGDGAGAVVVSAAGAGRRRDPRFRARDRRQRRAGAVHAGRRQPAAAVARDGRSAAALREAGRRRRCSSSPCARPRRSPGACSSATASRPTTSICSCRTRRTAASSSRRPRSSASIRDKVIINIERFGNTTAATIPLALNDAVCVGPAEEGRSGAARVGRRRVHRRRGAAALGVLTPTIDTVGSCRAASVA